MARFSTRIQSPLPAGEAFAYLADLTNFAKWDPGVRRAEQVGGVGVGDGAGLGAEFDVEVKGVAGATTLRYRLTTYRPPEEVVAEATTRLFRSLDRITVEPVDEGGSVVTYDAELTMRGVLGVADPLLGKAFDRIGRRAEQGLVRALRGEPMEPEGTRS